MGRTKLQFEPIQIQQSQSSSLAQFCSSYVKVRCLDPVSSLLSTCSKKNFVRDSFRISPQIVFTTCSVLLKIPSIKIPILLWQIIRLVSRSQISSYSNDWIIRNRQVSNKSLFGFFNNKEKIGELLRSLHRYLF